MTTGTTATVPRTALYLRVSLQEQGEKYGLDSQRFELRAYAERNRKHRDRRKGRTLEQHAN